MSTLTLDNRHQQRKAGEIHKYAESPARIPGESLTHYAVRLAESYANQTTHVDRKNKGQFFTPASVAAFMAGLMDFQQKRVIRLLDPGAGIGGLSAAVCDRIIKLGKGIRIHIDAIENDNGAVPYLQTLLSECRKECETNGQIMAFRILKDDFILKYAPLIEDNSPSHLFSDLEPYDYVISNPPYAKLSAGSPQAKAMKSLVLGQPNIYPFFIAIALKILKEDGQIVFIVPRSFCSGLYYRIFRRWFLMHAQIEHLHLFESRKHIFDHDGVLQENIILKAKPNTIKDNYAVAISTSANRNFDQFHQHHVKYNDLIHGMRHEADLITIPINKEEAQLQRMVNKWQETLQDLGLEISTGPVVDFRAKEYLRLRPSQKTVPLLWMHNMRGMETSWDIEKEGKAPAIVVCAETESLLLPAKNFVLLKRFTSKEQHRRLYASILLRSQFPYQFVGVENHLNYIYRPGGELTKDEAFGIAAFLNSTIADIFFRMINGNTQVNASDIRTMPFPPLAQIQKLGTLVRKKKIAIGQDLDNSVASILGEKEKIMELIIRLRRYNGKNK